jgi:DNA-binding NarL/FixJ family response regulator
MRILLADDHPHVRNGLRLILEAHDFVICAEAENGLQAVQQAQESKPDLVILDVSMPDMNGFDAAREILRNQPNLPIIMLSVHDSSAQTGAARELGMRGFVSKAKASDDLIKAIEMVAGGKTYFPPNARTA